MTAIDIRIRDLAAVSTQAIARKLAIILTDEEKAVIHNRIELLLREIATGQTILTPNHRQVAESQRS